MGQNVIATKAVVQACEVVGRVVINHAKLASINNAALSIGMDHRCNPVRRVSVPSSAGKNGPCGPKWINGVRAGISLAIV